jgi:hypothetical protein
LPLIPGDRGIAAALDATPPRIFWLRGGHVWTATAAGQGATALTIAFEGGCKTDPAGSIDNPWVRPDGGRLLFNASALTSACAVATGSQYRLYYVDLDPSSGQPTGEATQIFSDAANHDDVTPSLSPDACTLLFARSSALAQAPRQ